jgi:acyl transferase domain-containing protein/NAD(P)-dependent dehydrogenase (short-subunit alcohol dehydrogenase family)
VPLAIIGIGCLFPKADHLDAYWANIIHGIDAITEVPCTHWRAEDYCANDCKASERLSSSRGGFISSVEFNPMEFGIPPNAIEAIDTSQLLGLVVTQQALRDAGYGPDRTFDRERVSVILGVTGTLELVIPLGARLGHPIWHKCLREAGVEGSIAEDVVRRISNSYVSWQENSFPGLLGNVVAGRIAKHFDLGGTNCVVDAACASSLSALHMGALELASRRCDMVITGGIDTFNDIFMYTCFSQTHALSPSGNAKPFDIEADGTILGEGLGILVLKRFEDARRDGDKIYAVIRSIGTSSDGKGQAIYAPDPAGQMVALREAYRLAGVTPDTIELVEAHGTGTKAGDASELKALTEVYRSAQKEGTWCALGSVKSQIGHTKAAAGMAGVIKAVLALYHKVLPPTIKVTQPQKELASEETPFYINTEKLPWIPRNDHPRRAAVSSFGFGGSNFHCMLEEYGAEKSEIYWDGHIQLLALSASDLEELKNSLQTWPVELSWEAFREKAAQSRSAFKTEHHYRLVLVVEKDRTNITRLLANARMMLEKHPQKKSWSTPDGAYFSGGTPTGKLCVIFPGQGSQYVGMLRDLACQFPQMQRGLTEADRVFIHSGALVPKKAINGPNLVGLIYPHPVFTEEAKEKNQRALQATQITQPAIGAVSLGVFKILEYFGIQPEAVAGHSYGELTALCASGRIDPKSLHSLSILRGQLMAEGNGDGDRGAMLAAQASIGTMDQLIREENLDVIIANKNGPNQAVLSGFTKEIERAAHILTNREVRNKRLPVSGAFHSSLVAHVQKPFLSALQEIEFLGARIPVFANTTAREYPENTDEARHLLASQLVNPVEFAEQIKNMYEFGVRTFLETGPGAKLTGLVKGILEEHEHEALSVDSSAGKRVGLYDLACTLALLAAQGYDIKLSLWDAGIHNRETKRQSKKPRMTIPVCGANYVKPKPPRGQQTEVKRQGSEAKSEPVVVFPPSTTAPICSQTGTMQQLKISSQHSASSGQQTSEFYPSAPDQDYSSKTSTPLSDPKIKPLTLGGQPVDDQRSETSDLQLLRSATPDPSSRPAANDSSLQEALQITQENIAGLQKIHEQTAQLHRQFLEGQEAAQRTFQMLVEKQQKLLQASLAMTSHKFDPTVPLSPQHLDSPPVPQAEPQVARPEHQVSRPEISPQRHKESSPAFHPSVSSSLEESVSLSSPVPVFKDNRIETILLEVVAEKTGYPVEMLETDMELDSDLGIDSIKRVEILSALQERLPAAPSIKPEHLGTLKTLGQIVEFLTTCPNTSEIQQPETGNQKPTNHTSHPVSPNLQPDFFGSILLEVVAEKTGYPVEMLEMDMELDSDLGIDSIKRVEILSALQEKLPDAPAIKPEHLGTLKTLGQIVEFLSRSLVKSSAEVQESPQETIPLPTAHTPSETQNSEFGSVNSIERWVLSHTKLDENSCRPSISLLEGSPIWITDDGSDLALKVKGHLESLNYRAELVSLENLQNMQRPSSLGGLLILSPSRDANDTFLKNSFKLLQLTGPGLRSAGKNGGSILVTVSRLDGFFGLTGVKGQNDPASGGLAGLLKTARHEWSEVHCKALDLADDFENFAEATSAIVDEIFLREPLEVGLSKEGRHELQLSLAPLKIEIRSAPIAPGDVVVITGGARGITAEVAVALSDALKPTLILLGRSEEPSSEPDWLAGLNDESAIKKELLERAGEKALPRQIEEQYRQILANREILHNILRMKATGSQVIYRSVDIRNAEAVQSLVEGIRRHVGPISGLIHGAGVLADRLIEEKTEEQFDLVYSTKVTGLRALLKALEPNDLKLMVFFSSSTGRYGRTGQVAYAAANEVLNKIAQQQARLLPHCRVVSVNWGPWDGGMVTPSLKKLFEKEGVGLIDLEAGARYLVREITTNSHRPVEVVILGKDSYKECAVADNASTAPQTSEGDVPQCAFPTPQAVTSNEQPVTSNQHTTLAFERQLDVESYPFLKSHVMNGRAVLPMAMIIEWMAHGALHRSPGLRFIGFDNLRILKGVIIDENSPRTIRLMAGKGVKKDTYRVVPVELCTSKGNGEDFVHARGEILLGTSTPKGNPSINDITLRVYSRRDTEIYNSDLLFHGLHLQGIDRIEGCSEEGIAAMVRAAPTPTEWIEQPLRNNWLADPLVLDSAFQMMILWSFEENRVGSLPCFAGRYRQFESAFPKERVRIVIRVTKRSEHRALANMEFFDPRTGRLIAQMEDYECVMDASLSPAFHANRLGQEKGVEASA